MQEMRRLEEAAAEQEVLQSTSEAPLVVALGGHSDGVWGGGNPIQDRVRQWAASVIPQV